MKEEKMHLINKIFNNDTIRTVWDKEKIINTNQYEICIFCSIIFL